MHHVDSTNGVIYLIEFFFKILFWYFHDEINKQTVLDYKRLVASIIGLQS